MSGSTVEADPLLPADASGAARLVGRAQEVGDFCPDRWPRHRRRDRRRSACAVSRMRRVVNLARRSRRTGGTRNTVGSACSRAKGKDGLRPANIGRRRRTILSPPAESSPEIALSLSSEKPGDANVGEEEAADLGQDLPGVQQEALRDRLYGCRRRGDGEARANLPGDLAVHEGAVQNVRLDRGPHREKHLGPSTRELQDSAGLYSRARSPRHERWMGWSAASGS